MLIIVRHANERTLEFFELLKKNEAVKIIYVSEAPFYKTLVRCLEIAKEEGKKTEQKFFLCLDADVLVHWDNLQIFLNEFDLKKKKYFGGQAFVKDKFFPTPRMAGVHVYRFDVIDELLSILEGLENEIRPETAMMRVMEGRGYKYLYSRTIVGLHDFEQYYRDVFRKTMVHSVKHLEVLPTLIPFWRKKRNEDCDYEIALRGVAAGILFNKKIESNVELIRKFNYFDGLFEKTNEKCNLNDVEEINSMVQGIILRGEKYQVSYGYKMLSIFFRIKKWVR